MVKKNKKTKEIRKKAIWIGAVVGGVNLLLSIFFISIFSSQSYDINSVIFLFIIHVLSGALTGLILGIFINRITSRLFLTSIFLLSLIMGLLGVPPFGTRGLIGDIVMPIPTLVVILPIFPIIVVFWLLNLLGMNVMAGESVLRWLVIILGVIGYYYLFSYLITSQLKHRKKNKNDY